MGRPPGHTPRATYRLQIRPGFDLFAAAEQVDYLAALGVSHVYASPLLQARPGSEHGYDVTDPTSLDSQRGGRAGLDRLLRALRDAGMGLVLDIVPNHLAVGDHNPWWWDVLTHGPGSDHAAVFDIDWERGGPGPPRVVLPILGEDDRSALRLVDEDGEPQVAYHDRRFPVRPGTAGGGLEEVLARQHYRLVGWRSGARQLNYRRFFDITGLAGVRVEDPEVFRATHARVLELVDEGAVEGLRVDHPDGLRDPAGYLHRLREAVGPDCWIVVEKILEPGERLRRGWPVAGTVGYSFGRLTTALQVAQAGRRPLTALWDGLTGQQDAHRDFELEVQAAKREVVADLLGAEWRRLSRIAAELAEASGMGPLDPDGAPATVLRELLVALPVYRSYVDPEAPEPAPEDLAVLDQAVATARVRLAAGSSGDPEPAVEGLLELIADVLALRRRPPGSAELVAAFQQTAGAVMAKGKEDTALYRYLRLVCLNEVGGDPDGFACGAAALHAANAERQHDWPGAMLTTSTHDTKRSEDVRARLAVVSEIPDRWVAAVQHWQSACGPLRSQAGPRPALEYLAWQTALGAWPIGGDRLAAYLTKAAREAKRAVSWRDRDAAYEQAVVDYAHGLVDHEGFLGPLRELLAVVLPAGRVNSLAQSLLKLTSPGVGDLYQGQELWDLSLVDPDNRRPVDFERRRELLDGLDGPPEPERLLARDDEGVAKLWTVRRTLQLRRERPGAFGEHAGYRPLATHGPREDHVLGFVRGGELAVVVPRLTVALGVHPDAWAWEETSVELPAGEWLDHLSDRRHEGGGLPVGSLLARFPVALLTRR